MKLAVIGLGVVGRHMRADIERAGHTCLTYDIVGEGHATRAQINTCDAAFVCVGTPATPEGEADLSAIAAVFAWPRIVHTLDEPAPPADAKPAMSDDDITRQMREMSPQE